MEDQPHNADLPALLEDARRRLVETGTRNRLIHVNRSATRTKAMDILGARGVDLFDSLRVQGKRMRFLPREEGPEEELDLDEPHLSPMLREDLETGRGRDLYLATRLGPEALQRRLLTLHADARTAEEEQGVNILYLAIGFLRWYESDSSQVLRESPLILVPVELVRDDRRATFDLKMRDTEIVTNLPLQERLKADFGFDLPDIEDDEAFSPDSYFADLEDRIGGRPRWSLDPDGAQLGFFSFSKLLMMRDLEAAQWPEGAFEEHPVLGGLLGAGFDREPPLFGPQEPLDPRLPPETLLHVVPADASQTRVIEEVRAGRNLVVQGPPGTGKSQTIANIIAAAAHDGKTVLFVAEKMAALSVVHDRLRRVGLGELCLEIHSRAANKKAFLDELARTLAAGRDAPEPPEAPEALREARDRLNRITALLHEPVPGQDYTPFRVIAEIARLIGRDVPPPQIPSDSLENLDEPARRELVDRLATFVELTKQAGPEANHPFAGVGETGLQPTDLQRVGPELDATIQGIAELRERAAGAAEAAGLPVPETMRGVVQLQELLHVAASRPLKGREATELLLPRVGDQRVSEALSAGVDWAQSRAEAAPNFSEAAFEIAPETLRARLLPGVGSFWARLFGGYRGASRELATLLAGPLPSTPADRLRLVDQLISVRRRRATLSDEEGWLREALGPHWRGERTPFVDLQMQADWLTRVVSLTQPDGADAVDRICAAATQAEALDRALETAIPALDTVVSRLDVTWANGDETRLDEIGHRLGRMRAELDRYGEWARLARSAAGLRASGLSPLLDGLKAGTLRPDAAVDELLYAISEARWRAARSALPDLDTLAHQDRHALVASFQDLERDRLEETRRLVRAGHLAQLPTGAAGQMGFLRGEMAKKRRHRPIRQIMRAAGPMVQRIKPVLLMSPISIAQYLPPGAASFDLLVIDEASQVRPEEALGAIARCKQIVVVGDQKQLPPTSFFDRLSGGEEVDEEETDEVRSARATEMESVLTLCEARGLNPAMLEWHYRSRDPSLITVNNAEFYDHRLILPPSPVQNDPDYGLAFRQVAGVYSSRSRGEGRPGTNRIEAEEIAREIAEHARTRSDMSLGVVAFSKAQSDMITEVLELARRQDEILDAFLREGRSEDVFVKNIENVQGDERDVILVSVGYGPSEPGGRLTSMSFGPINGEGGERRLNVLFSRARTRCLVFCSFDPGDIDLSRVSRDGPRVLKGFLEFARSGQMAQPEVTGELPDSPFESDVADVIRRLGYPCDYQVGSAGFKIDLGVRHPDRLGRYILAVECDGATYHSALWARERDRLRQDVLEGLGWRFHRIWSTDWFHRRANEIDRLRDALDAARDAEGPALTGANHDGVLPPEQPMRELSGPELPPPPELRAPPYVASSFTVSVGFEPHEAPSDLLFDLVIRIVEAEGPIHRDLIARRVGAAFGKSRTGGRIRAVSDVALDRAVAQGRLLLKGEFAMTEAQHADPPFRDRSEAGTPVSQAGFLPPLEIRAAAARVLAESGDTSREELVVATARLLGFARVGADLREVIDVALMEMG